LVCDQIAAGTSPYCEGCDVVCRAGLCLATCAVIAREGYSWAEDKEHCEEYGRMLNADPTKVWVWTGGGCRSGEWGHGQVPQGQDGLASIDVKPLC
jgi:hypothetical protein